MKLALGVDLNPNQRRTAIVMPKKSKAAIQSSSSSDEGDGERELIGGGSNFDPPITTHRDSNFDPPITTPGREEK